MAKKTLYFHLALFNVLLFLLLSLPPAEARVKFVALPGPGKIVLHLDNPSAALVEEDRSLTLEKGLNRVDFSWKGVRIDRDSVRMTILCPKDQASLLNVGFPPGEEALLWEIYSKEAGEVSVRISYLLSRIDGLLHYKAVADKEEKTIDLRGFLVLRNFSGEDFQDVVVLPAGNGKFSATVKNGETQKLPVFHWNRIPVVKVWTFDARRMPWDPEKQGADGALPVSYRIKGRLGPNPSTLPEGKVRIFLEDGRGGTLFLGEGRINQDQAGEEATISVGYSRDVVVKQRKTLERRIHVRRNDKNRIVLYDSEEEIRALVRNFKDSPVKLLMIQHIPGQWEMKACNLPYERKEAGLLEFHVTLPAKGEQELTMRYIRRNIRREPY
ncbi:MAG: hypothetical protein JRH13_08220 [Deltaproteobacteria bacterium]|nr:hypothetical protein [Deltaproteobacteria bacterium]